MADNAFSVRVPNALEALMAGEQGYKDVSASIKQNRIDSTREQAAQDVLQGGNPQNALARLLSVGDDKGAATLATVIHNQQQGDFQNRSLAATIEHQRATEKQGAASLAETAGFHKGTLAQQDAALNKPQLISEVDPFTNEKTHIIFDPRTKTATPIRAPSAAQPVPAPIPAPVAAQPVPVSPNSSVPPATAEPVATPAPPATGGRNEQVFQALRPDMQGPVKDLVDGKTTLESYLPRQRPILERAARAYSPGWSPADNTLGLSPNAIEMGGRQLAGGNLAALTNVGRGAQSGRDLAKLRNKAADVLINEHQLTPTEAAEYLNKQEQRYKAEQSGQMAQSRSLGTMEARMGTAAFEAEGAIKLARGIIEKVDRTTVLPFNKLIELKDKNLLNPDQAELFTRTQGVVNAYAAVMSRGASVTTDASRHRAEELLNTASNPATYNRVLDTMQQEINMAKNAPEAMRDFYSVKYGHKSLGSPPAATTPAASSDTPPPVKWRVLPQ